MSGPDSSFTSQLSVSPREGLRGLARFGAAAKGFVYVLVGALAAMAATGLQGGETTDKRKVLQTILDMPLGRVLLGVVALGLVGYVIWRFAQAIIDTKDQGHDAKGVAHRLSYAFSGLVYGALAVYAGRLALNGGSGGDGDEGGMRQSLVAKALALPAGEWLVGAVALGVVGAGVYQIYRAYSGRFSEEVNSSQLSGKQRRLVYRMGQLGYTARGVVWAILGYFLLQAALQFSPRQAQGTEAAFDFLRSMGTGPLLVVSLGFVAYGLYMLVRAKYPVLSITD